MIEAQLGMPAPVKSTVLYLAGVVKSKSCRAEFVRHIVVGTVPEPVANKVVELLRQIGLGLAAAGVVNVGAGLTATDVVIEFEHAGVVELSVIVYVITVLPAVTPLTIPLESPTVATAVLLLDQVPPEGEPVNVI